MSRGKTNLEFKNQIKLPEEAGESMSGQSIYITQKLDQLIEDKRLIARYIVRTYIRSFDAVAIDAGSTLMLITDEMMNTNQKWLSVLTNNMTAFSKASQRSGDNEFILTGGKYVSLFDALLGKETLHSFTEYYARVVIIGVSGLAIVDKESKGGFFCHGDEEFEVKRMLFQKPTDRRIIPVDFRKIGQMDSYEIGSVSSLGIDATYAYVVTIKPPALPTENERKDNINYDEAVEIVHKYSHTMEKLKAAAGEKGSNVKIVELPRRKEFFKKNGIPADDIRAQWETYAYWRDILPPTAENRSTQ